jgi:hypothetical protein
MTLPSVKFTSPFFFYSQAFRVVSFNMRYKTIYELSEIEIRDIWNLVRWLGADCSSFEIHESC